LRCLKKQKNLKRIQTKVAKLPSAEHPAAKKVCIFFAPLFEALFFDALSTIALREISN